MNTKSVIPVGTQRAVTRRETNPFSLPAAGDRPAVRGRHAQYPRLRHNDDAQHGYQRDRQGDRDYRRTPGAGEEGCRAQRGRQSPDHPRREEERARGEEQGLSPRRAQLRLVLAIGRTSLRRQGRRHFGRNRQWRAEGHRTEAGAEADQANRNQDTPPDSGAPCNRRRSAAPRA